MSKRVFLAAPFKGTIKEKQSIMKEQEKKRIEDLILFLEEKGLEVDNAHKREEWGANFMSPDQCTKLDYDAIKECDLFIAFPGVPVSPGTHIEIGWASAMGKEIILLLAEKEENYAYLIRGLHTVSNVHYIIYNEEKEYLQKLDLYLDGENNEV
ncbi:5-hydroxymethylcytidine 5'-monophosphate nucleosidase subunit BcmB [Clostridium botulinum]|uniref:5-hydroxymethylcytidine 5'-monophosphate nucleosidase subunit BcmB n=1 Tax=Clostridium botulinum TaxID=1491 RepID=UPI0017493FF7|nr:5-hydroxymethylcytidine 5'-monophosphate nucleosidase subunit BcmB [Clostridium botulinum]MBD5574782.1 5-hydroxymethylcytidine 5'-monophosphate nucleosidase subunit BcmB [Clostridium botulinum]